MTTQTTWQLYLFGSFRMERAGELIRLPTRKIESLLAFLVLYPDAHAREKLAALLWGDVSDEQARGSLRKALTHLRAALGDDLLLTDRQTVQLNPDFKLWCDVREFESVSPMRAWASLDALHDTRAHLDMLYQGDLLADLYDDWVFPLREEYRTRLVNVLLGLTQQYRAQSEYARAIETAQRVLHVDAANERAHQHLMFCFAASGERLAALKQYEECVRTLREELGVEPARETVALYNWIQQFSGERATSEALATNLPIPLSSFIGRQAETTALKNLLKSDVRLVTLTGPGGSGKTRLAIRTATDLMDAFPDGVWWVELAAIADAGNVAPQIAKTLGVREAADEPLLQTLKTFLQDKSLWLILDNCEHVLEESARVANEMLTHCAQLKILATSREPLRIAGEHIYPVPTMNVPRRDAWSYIDLLQEFEGVRLFVERAQAIQSSFRLTEHNAPAVAQICARLDGIPLALELAASRVKILSPQEIAARLDARFDLLKDANRAAPPRHQTLRAVLDWSCELLSERERALFRHMAVFAGGCTLDALNAVASDAKANSLLDTLTQLVDKSLVIATTYGATTRYGMLETIREYAREMLAAATEENEIHARHLETYLVFADTAEPNLRGAAQRIWLARLDAELDNLRAALEWASAHDVEKGLQIAGALEWFWNLRGHWSEGAQWLTRLLAISNAPTRGRARALLAASNLKFWGEQDFAAAQEWLAESIVIYRALPAQDTWHLAYALAMYGGALDELETTEGAQGALDESLALAAELGNEGKWVRAEALLLMKGKATASERHKNLQESAALFQELGDVAQLPVTLAHLAWFCSSLGEYAKAQHYAAEGMRLTEEIGDKLGVAWYEKLFGDMAGAQHDYARAAAQYQKGYERFQALGNTNGMAATRDGLEWARAQQAE